MKYIKSYEDVKEDIIKEYIKESKPLTEEETIIYIENHCTEWLNNPKAIYRGVNGDMPQFLSDPVKRISRDNKNFYNLIIDNSPAWKGYPKRSESFCCSTKHSSYGNTCYVVIPEDNSKWAISPKHDIWTSFNNLINKNFKNPNIGCEELFRHIDQMATTMKIELSDTNYNKFKEGIKQLETRIKKHEPGDTLEGMFVKNKLMSKLRNRAASEKIYDTIYNSKNFWRTILNTIKPKDFKLLDWDNTKSHINKSSIYDKYELWTDSTCVFIDNSNIKPMLKKLGINLNSLL